MRRPVTEAAGRVGIWTWTLDTLPLQEVVAVTRLIEQLGYGAVWFKEDFGRDALTTAALLLSHTDLLVVANGVASMYARDATAMRAAQRTLAEAHSDRHLLGVGISHSVHVARRGRVYGSPAATAEAYLSEMEAATYISPEPAARPVTLLAALGPRMLAIAARRAAGVHTFGATVAHTAIARHAIGPDAFLAPVQPIVLDDDVRRAGRPPGLTWGSCSA